MTDIPRPGEPLCDADAAKLVALCCLAYFCAYIGRLNYGACAVQILQDLNASQADGGLVSSFFFMAYGVGQVLNGVLSQRTRSIRMVALALSCSALTNLLMPWMGDVRAMKYLWLINGLAQSMLWPHIIKIYASALSGRQLAKAVVAIHTVGASGTVAVYLSAAAAIRTVGWRALFFIASGLLVAMALTWYTAMGRLDARRAYAPAVPDEGPRPEPQRGAMAWSRMIACGLPLAFVCCVMNGALRDGITLWMPTYIKSTFGLGSALAVFVSVGVPMLQISGAFLAGFVKRRLGGLFGPVAVFFLVSGICLGALAIRQGNLIITCVLFMLAATCMTAINAMLVSFWPISLAGYGLESMAAGVTNSFVYMGSAAASYATGAIADRSGWNAALWMLCMGAAIAFVACALGLRRYERAQG